MSTGQSTLLQVLQKRVKTLISEDKLEDALRVAHTAVEAARRRASADRTTMPNLASALLILGDIHRMLDELPAAEESYLEGLHHMERVLEESPRQADDLEIARLQSGLASIYDFTSREEEAIPLYEGAIERLESHDPPELEEAAHISNNLAMIYKQLGEHERAADSYRKALEIFEEIHGAGSGRVATVLNNLGSLYSSMENHEEALRTHRRALQIRERSQPRDIGELGQSLCNLATAYHELEDFNNARKHYEAALRLFEKNLAECDSDYEILMSNYAQLLRDHGQERKAHQLEKRVQSRLRKLGHRTAA